MRKVAVVVNSRANYGRICSVMTALREDPGAQLISIVGASALLESYGKVDEVMVSEGFKVDYRSQSIVSGDNHGSMSRSIGLGILEITSIFQSCQPDIVVTIADRFDTMATAIAARVMNIPLAHTQGGDISGSIDDFVRHSITKLADIHFPATKRSAEVLAASGEPEERIFNFGCPAMDLCADLPGKDTLFENGLFSDGVGANIGINDDFMLIVYHPVTTTMEQAFSFETFIDTIERASKYLGKKCIWFWPNVDAGGDEVSKLIRRKREHSSWMNDYVRIVKNVTPQKYALLLKHASVCVGNSSSFIRECAFLGTPTIVFGDRQLDREHADNCIFVNLDVEKLFEKIITQAERKFLTPSRIFGDGNAGRKIASVLTSYKFTNLKRFTFG